MEEWCNSYFGQIENKNVEIPNLVEPHHPFRDEEKGSLLKFVPVKNQDILQI
jgi:secreted Zn-dependent insulinase-like peptidase